MCHTLAPAGISNALSRGERQRRQWLSCLSKLQTKQWYRNVWLNGGKTNSQRRCPRRGFGNSIERLCCPNTFHESAARDPTGHPFEKRITDAHTASIFFRPSSSTDAPIDHITENKNTASTRLEFKLMTNLIVARIGPGQSFGTQFFNKFGSTVRDLHKAFHHTQMRRRRQTKESKMLNIETTRLGSDIE